MGLYCERGHWHRYHGAQNDSSEICGVAFLVSLLMLGRSIARPSAPAGDTYTNSGINTGHLGPVNISGGIRVSNSSGVPPWQVAIAIILGVMFAVSVVVSLGGFSKVGDNYTNSGVNLGHIVPNNNFGKQPFDMTDSVMNQVFATTAGWGAFGVSSLHGDAKSSAMASKLAVFLRANGRDAHYVEQRAMLLVQQTQPLLADGDALIVGTGALGGDIGPYSSDRFIYLDADK